MKAKLFLNLMLFSGIYLNGQTITLTSNTPQSNSTGGASSVKIGSFSGNLLNNGPNNVFLGYYSGNQTIDNGNNVFLGSEAGYSNKAWNNVFIGYRAGKNGYDVNNSSNVLIGTSSGENLQTGNNVAIGFGSLQATSAGWNNTVMGFQAGQSVNGHANVLLGSKSGLSAGNGNIMIGNSAGELETGNNKLYIHNNSSIPTIYGDLENLKIGIGGINSFPTVIGEEDIANYKLFVKGGILTEELRLSLISNWPDYVFNDDYELMPLKELEKSIEKEGHLPNIPSAKEMEENGINVSELMKKQMEKLEELTLYIISQEKKIEEMQKEIEVLKNKKL